MPEPEEFAAVTLNFGPDGLESEIDPRVSVPGSLTSNIVNFPEDEETFYVHLILHDLTWPFMDREMQAQMPRGAKTSILIRGSIIKELGLSVTTVEAEHRARRQQG